MQSKGARRGPRFPQSWKGPFARSPLDHLCWRRRRHSAGMEGTDSMAAALVRPRDRWIAGVCSGLARRFGKPPNFVRLLFAVSCLLPGPQFLIYIILWIIIPSE
jgi:phage shock protein PspC (stress-responsive transcriptional regulator)